MPAKIVKKRNMHAFVFKMMTERMIEEIQIKNYNTHTNCIIGCKKSFRKTFLQNCK